MWSFEHSVECAAGVEQAWAFWTDVRNWALDSDVERIEIDGAFETGTHARTFSKAMGKIEWQLAEVEFGRAVIETPVDGAVARSVWTFDADGERTRITQRMSLEGPRAEFYAQQYGPMLEAGMPAGMQKLAAAIGKNSSRR